MRHRGQIARLITIVAMALVVAPSAAVAAPSEESCASAKIVPFSLAVPDAVRAIGTHRFEWYSTFTNPDGTTADGLAENQITISASAPIYPNRVLLRLVRNTTILADGSVIEVPVMNPAQAAQFYIAAFSFKNDDVFLNSFRTWFRYETTKNHWTAFVELARGPLSSLCAQNDSQWKKSYGWT